MARVTLRAVHSDPILAFSKHSLSAKESNTRMLRLSRRKRSWWTAESCSECVSSLQLSKCFTNRLHRSQPIRMAHPLCHDHASTTTACLTLTHMYRLLPPQHRVRRHLRASSDMIKPYHPSSMISAREQNIDPLPISEGRCMVPGPTLQTT